MVGNYVIYAHNFEKKYYGGTTGGVVKGWVLKMPYGTELKKGGCVPAAKYYKISDLEVCGQL